MSEGILDTETKGLRAPREKFKDPDWTVTGTRRARVRLTRLDTLWFNTGTLCNIQCLNCYIESSPTNDRLAYISAREVADYLDDIAALGLGTQEIGFTGGEPFMNPEFLAMVEDALSRGFHTLILTNAMQPMLRPHVKQGLSALKDRFGEQLVLRVSLDHYTARLHDTERGAGSFAKAIEGLDWLSANGFRVAIAGRTCWNEADPDQRAGYADLFKARGVAIDTEDPAQLVLLPEMDDGADVPEITTECWRILGLHPSDIMCATSRMVAKRRGEQRPVVLPCTLLPYDQAFEMGTTLAEAARADGGMFERGAVKLCHTHCARFCVLGGGHCSG